MCLSCGSGDLDDDHDDPCPITITDLEAAADAAGISLTEAAWNILASVTGAPGGDGAALEVLKGGAPQRYVLGVAYQPGPDPRIARGQDGGRDYFTEAELEKACFSYLASGSPVIGISHLDGTTGAATVVESYIYRNPEPWDIGNGITVSKGTWLIGAILDEKSWELAQAGKLNGFSPQGTARRRRPQGAPDAG